DGSTGRGPGREPTRGDLGPGGFRRERILGGFGERSCKPSDRCSKRAAGLDVKAVPGEAVRELWWRVHVDRLSDRMSYAQRDRVDEILLPEHDGRRRPLSNRREISQEVFEGHPSTIVLRTLPRSPLAECIEPKLKGH